MDFSIPEETIAVRELAARILGDSIDDAARKAFDRGELRWHERAWVLLGQAGLPGVALPEAMGGSGLGFGALCAVLEEQGRQVAALPLLASTVLGALPLARFGTPEQHARWLPRVADGSAVLSGALAASPLEPMPHTLPRLLRRGSVLAIEGELSGVPWGAEADALLVPVRDAADAVSVFIVERARGGLEFDTQRGTDHEPFATVHIESAVEPAQRVGDDGVAVLQWIAERAATALGFIQLGVVAEALRRTAQHVIERRQFGKPLAAFQAVAHRTADSFIDVEALRSTLWQAAWRLEQELPATNAVAVAAWWASEAGHRVAHACQHLHGGTGADLDYPIHRYFLWAQQTRLALGGSARILGGFGRVLSTQQIEVGQ